MSDYSPTYFAIVVEEMTLKMQELMGRPLRKKEQQDIRLAFAVMNEKFEGKKFPRPFQMKTALDIINGKNVVVRAGTGAGKTLAMGLIMLLRPYWTVVTIAPLKALQQQHVSTHTIVCILYLAEVPYL